MGKAEFSTRSNSSSVDIPHGISDLLATYSTVEQSVIRRCVEGTLNTVRRDINKSLATVSFAQTEMAEEFNLGELNEWVDSSGELKPGLGYSIITQAHSTIFTDSTYTSILEELLKYLGWGGGVKPFAIGRRNEPDNKEVLLIFKLDCVVK